MKKSSILVLLFFAALFAVELFYVVKYLPAFRQSLSRQKEQQKERELHKYKLMDRVSEKVDSLRRLALVIADADTRVYHYDTRCLKTTDNYILMTEPDAEKNGFILCEECEEIEDRVPFIKGSLLENQ